MTVGTYWVNTPDLRAALQAVRPHADATKTGGDGTEALNRLRLYFDPQAGHVRVMATNTVTTGLAVVSLTGKDGAQGDLFAVAPDDGSIAPAVADITPDRAGSILGYFPARSSDDARVRIEVGDEWCNFADASGRDALTVQRPPDGEMFPDVWEIVKRAAHAAQQTPQPKPLTVLGKHLAKFAAASEAFDRPLTVVPSGSADARGFVVRVSREFLGLVESRHQDDDSMSKREADWLLWLDRFAGKRQVAA